MARTLRDRVNYHLSFSLSERWEIAKEKAARWVAYRLPQRVRYWVIVHRHGELTTGENGNVHPDSVKAFDLYFED